MKPWPLPLVGLDTETNILENGTPTVGDLRAPLLTCVSVSFQDGTKALYDHVDGPAIFEDLLDEAIAQTRIITVHNLGFDVLTICQERPDLWPKVFKALKMETLICSIALCKLHDIEAGEYDSKNDCIWSRVGAKNTRVSYRLDDRVLHHCGQTVPKDDEIRKTFGALRGVPVADYDPRWFNYAVEDAYWHVKLSEDVGPHHNIAYQSRASVWLAIASARGFALDEESVLALEQSLQAEMVTLEDELIAAGFLRMAGTKKKPKLSKNMKVIKDTIIDIAGDAAPLTDKGNIKTDRDSILEVIEMATTDEEKAVAEELRILPTYTSTQKLLSTYVKAMKLGITSDIHTRFKPLIGTGRTSSGAPNIQNLPRAFGVRECFIARPGFWLLDADYSTLELRTLGQSCLWIVGYSKLAEALNAGLDPHLDFGRQLHPDRPSYAEAQALLASGCKIMKHFRQLAKIANFGLPGGLGVNGLVAYMKGYGVEIDLVTGQALIDGWLAQWPEMDEYFAHIREQTVGGFGFVQLHASGRVRGGVKYTEAANYMFQGPAADGAKEAGFLISEECYAVPESPLFGSHIVNFIHDEYILEVPADAAKATSCATRLVELMCTGMSEFVPDIKIEADAHLMRRWYKNAGPVLNEAGLLIPWEPS